MNNSTVEPAPAKGHSEPSHDILVMRLRERIDAQTKVMTEQFARIKELEGIRDNLEPELTMVRRAVDSGHYGQCAQLIEKIDKVIP